jgi:hypothetical protein
MLDRGAAESPGRGAAALLREPGRDRRRALIACAVAVLALHAAFLGNIGGPVPGAAETSVALVSLRTLPDELPAAEAPVTELPAPEAAAPSVAAAPAATAPPPAPAPPKALPRQVREPAATTGQPAVSDEEKASANSTEVPSAVGATASGDSPPARAADMPTVAVAEAPAGAAADIGEAHVPAGPAAAGARSPLLAPGDEPPPLYRTQLPPSATLHYQVRRGFQRGTGLIRWAVAGDRYRLVLEAQVAGLTLLMQTSEGDVGANGLAPVRFLDRRARRSAQAANFRRDDGRITFSGTGVEWPLLAGSQDRLSWMIQLAGIAAAEPERLVEGGRITMVVIGARGDAGVWALTYAGRETIESVRGAVHAVKLVRAGRSAYDTSAEIWLDPERSYLPVHATLRNNAGASEYDLLLERVEPD